MTKSYEVLVPLSELGLEQMTGAELKAYAGLSGLTIERDYLDRPAVSLEAAYKIAEARRRAEREYADAEVARRTEHAKAVAELQARCNAAFMEARTAALSVNVSAGLFGGRTEMDGTATNAGLSAARLVWAAAPAAVRDEVSSIQYDESGTTNVVPINTALPLTIVNDYVHSAVRQRRY
jgi:hypothetical protein